MKTRMLAMALDSGSVGDKRDQAWGFVSSTMVSSEGGGSDNSINSYISPIVFLESQPQTYHQNGAHSAPNRRLRSWRWRFI